FNEPAGHEPPPTCAPESGTHCAGVAGGGRSGTVDPAAHGTAERAPLLGRGGRGDVGRSARIVQGARRAGPPGTSPMTAPTDARPGDQARAAVMVALPSEDAFRIFTEEIDQWWRRGLRYRVAGGNRGFIHLEPKLGGRLYESFEEGAATRVFETGTITAWEPPSRLVFEWRGANFRPVEKT